MLQQSWKYCTSNATTGQELEQIGDESVHRFSDTLQIDWIGYLNVINWLGTGDSASEMLLSNDKMTVNKRQSQLQLTRCESTHRAFDLRLDNTGWRADVLLKYGKSPYLKIDVIDENKMDLPYMGIVVWLARIAVSERLETRPLRMKSRDICSSVSELRSRDQSAWSLFRSMRSDPICWRAQHWLLWSFWSPAADWSRQIVRTFARESVCRVREVWQVSLQVSLVVRCCWWCQSACSPQLFAPSWASARWTRSLASSYHRASQSHSATAVTRVRTNDNSHALTRSSSAIFERIETPSTRTEAWPCVNR